MADDLLDRVDALLGKSGASTPRSGSPTSTTSSYRGKKALSQDELEDVLREAGWDEKHIPKMSAIGMAESARTKDGLAKVDSYNPGRGPGGVPTVEQSIGNWQINMHPSLGRKYDRQKLASDPVYNAKVALEIFKEQGYKAWGSYTDGRYRPFLRKSGSAPRDTTRATGGSDASGDLLSRVDALLGSSSKATASYRAEEKKPLQRPGQPLAQEVPPQIPPPVTAPAAKPPIQTPVPPQVQTQPPPQIATLGGLEPTYPQTPTLPPMTVPGVDPSKMFGGNVRVSAKVAGQPPVKPQKRYVTDSGTISDANYDEQGNVISEPSPTTNLTPQQFTRDTADDAVSDSILVPHSISTQAEAEKYVKGQLEAKYGVKIPVTAGFLGTWQKGHGAAITYGDLKAWGIDTVPLVDRQIAEQRITNPQINLGLQEYRQPGVEEMAVAEDQLRDQYRIEEIAKTDPTSVMYWFDEFTKNPLTRVADIWDRYKGTKPDIDAAVEQRLRQTIQQHGSAYQALQQKEKSSAGFLKPAIYGAQALKGLMVDNFAPMLETAGIAQSTLESYISGREIRAKDTDLYKAGQAMRSRFNASLPLGSGGWDEQIASTFGQAAGTLLLGAAGIAAAGASKWAMSIPSVAVGVSQMGSQAYQTAVAKGATEDQARLAVLLSLPGGFIEGLSEATLFKKLSTVQNLDRATGGLFSSQIMSKARQIGSVGANSAATELIEELVQGLDQEVARQVYDKRDWKQFAKDLDAAVREALIAIPVGFLLGGGAAAIQSAGTLPEDAQPNEQIPQSPTPVATGQAVPGAETSTPEAFKIGDRPLTPEEIENVKRLLPDIAVEGIPDTSVPSTQADHVSAKEQNVDTSTALPAPVSPKLEEQTIPELLATVDQMLAPQNIEERVRQARNKKLQPPVETEGGGVKSVAEFPDSLGILRSEMPQIRADDHEEFKTFAEQRGIKITPETATVKDLLPTQREYNPENAAQIPAEKLSKPLMVSSDNRVLDGHNTLVRLRENPDAEVKILRLNVPAEKALAAMREFPKSMTKAVEQVGRSGQLPQDHKLYFRDYKNVLPPDEAKAHITVPLDRLVVASVPADLDAQVERALGYMADTAAGKRSGHALWMAKRRPISVSDNGDGTYTVLDGRATLQAAKQSGWTDLPVEVVTRAGKTPGTVLLYRLGDAGEKSPAGKWVGPASRVAMHINDTEENYKAAGDTLYQYEVPIEEIHLESQPLGAAQKLGADTKARVVASVPYSESFYRDVELLDARGPHVQRLFDKEETPLKRVDLSMGYNREEVKAELDVLKKKYGAALTPATGEIPDLARRTLEVANEIKDDFFSDAKSVAEVVGGEVPDSLREFLVKGELSLEKKLSLNSSKVPTDLLRTTIVIPAGDAASVALRAAKVIEEFGKLGYQIAFDAKTGGPDVTNRYEDPEPGYKDVALKLVKDGDPVVRELQLLQPATFEAKKEGHIEYDLQKDVQDLLKNAKNLTAEDKAELEEINIALIQEMAATYEAAYAKDIVSSKPDATPAFTINRPTRTILSKDVKGLPDRSSQPSMKAATDLLSEWAATYLDKARLSPTERASKFFAVSANINVTSSSSIAQKAVSVEPASSGVALLEGPKRQREERGEVVASAISNEFERLFNKPISEMTDDEIVREILAHTEKELEWWNENKGDYKGFYTADRKAADRELRAWARAEHGRELTPEEVSLYHLVSAFGSPSADPIQDSSMGLMVFDKYLRTGELTGITDKQATVWSTNLKGKRYDTKALRFNPDGVPVNAKITRAYQAENLAAFNKLVDKFPGSRRQQIAAAIRWLQSEHPYVEVAKKFDRPLKGQTALKPNEYFTKDGGGYGIFGLTGTKLGSYFLNRTTTLETATKDLWYARTMARYFGQPLVQGKDREPLKNPWSDSTKDGIRYRALADQAWRKYGEKHGMELAEVQQAMWDFEKRLWEHLGHPAQDRVFITQGLAKGQEMVQKAKVTPRSMSATVGAAPLREGTVRALRGATQAFSGKTYREYINLAQDLSKTLGLTMHELQRTIGAYGATSSNFEASILPTVTGPSTDVRTFATLLATLAPDLQHSVLLSEYQEKGEDREYRITFKDKAAAEIFVANRHAAGFDDLSYVPGSRTVILLDIKRFGKFDLMPLVQQYGKDITHAEGRKAGIDFIGESDYRGNIQDARDSLQRHDDGKSREKLSGLLDRAEAKLRQEGLWEDQGLKSVAHEGRQAGPTSLRRGRTAESLQTRRSLYVADSEEVLAKANGGEIHANGEWEVSEADAEVLRRVLAGYKQSIYGESDWGTPFDGIVWSPAYMSRLVDYAMHELRSAVQEQYGPAALAGFDAVINNLDRLARESRGHQVVYVYDDALPHERMHKEDLDAGRTSEEALAKLKESPLWNMTPAFEEAYGKEISDHDRASELVAMIVANEADRYGYDEAPGYNAESKKFLDTWVQGVIENNIERIDEIGADAFAAAFPKISAIALATWEGEQSNANIQTDNTKTGRSDQKAPAVSAPAAGGGGATTQGQGQGQQADAAPGKDGQSPDLAAVTEGQELTDEEVAAITGQTVEQVQTKNRQFARTLAANLFDVGDVEYEPQTVRGWQAAAEKTLEEKGVDAAITEYRKMPAAESAGHKTALGVAIATELYAQGRTADLAQFGRELTENIGNAAQELRASALMARLHPPFAQVTGNKITNKAHGRDMTVTESEKLDALARKLEDVANNHAIALAALEATKEQNRQLDETIQTLERALSQEKARGKTDNGLQKALDAANAAVEHYKALAEGRSPIRVRGPKALREKRQALEAERSALVMHLQNMFPGTSLKSVARDAQTGTPEFKKWFKKSVVVDANGQPMVVAHATRADFDTFSLKPPGQKHESFAIHFGTPAQSRTMAGLRGGVRKIRRSGANTIPAYLSLQKPLPIPDWGDGKDPITIMSQLVYAAEYSRNPKLERQADLQGWWQGRQPTAFTSEQAQAFHKQLFGTRIGWNESADGIAYRNQKMQEVRDWVKGFGYDGLVYLNLHEGVKNGQGREDSYAVFSSTQVKSAIGNSGAFDPNEESVLKSPAHHGTPHVFKAELLVKMPDGKQEYIVGDVDKLPDVPKGATVIKRFPHGRMRLSKVGTGEGHQAYGYGLYFAGKKEIADWYRESLSPPDRVEYDGEPVAHMRDARDPAAGARYLVAANMLARGMNPDLALIRAKEMVERNVDSYWAGITDPDRIAEREYEKQTLQALNMLDQAKFKRKSGGARYNVDLVPEEDEYLDLDKPLYEQSDVVKDALGPAEQLMRITGGVVKGVTEDKDAGFKAEIQTYGAGTASRFGYGNTREAAIERAFTDITGRELYSLLTRAAIQSLNYGKPSQEFASNWLLQRGIRGNRYLDADSRHGHAGTSNYVIFSDEDVAIESVLKSVVPNDLSIDPETVNALVKVAAAKLIDELPDGKLTPKKFDEWLNGITNNTLGAREITTVHALAYEMSRVHTPLSDEAKIALRNRMAHSRRARAILGSENTGTDTGKQLNRQRQKAMVEAGKAYRDDRFAGQMLETASDTDAHELSVLMAFAQRETPDMRKLEQVYDQAKEQMGDDVPTFKQAMADGKELLDLTRETIRADRISAQQGRELTEKEVKDLEREARGSATEQRLARRAVETYLQNLKKSTAAEAAEVISGIYNLYRSVLFSSDLGFLLAQGGPTLLMHPTAWWRAVSQGIPPAMTTEFLNELMQKRGFIEKGEGVSSLLRALPGFKQLAEALGLTGEQFEDAVTKFYESEMRKRLEGGGVKFEQIGNIADFNDDFLSDLSKHLLFVKQTNRMHSLTTDLFRLYGGGVELEALDKMYEAGKISAKEYNRSKEFLLRKWINVMSGKGFLPGFLAGAGRPLAQVGAAPRFTISAFQIPWYANPVRAAFLPAGARKIMMQNSLKLWGPPGIALMALWMLGLINGDPEDKDFLQLRMDKLTGIKDFKINPLRALKEPIRVMVGLPAKKLYYMLTGNKEGSERINKEYFAQFVIDDFGSIGSFWQSKLHPTLSAASQIYTGKNFVGEPLGWSDIAPLPLGFKEGYKAATYDHKQSVLKTGKDSGKLKDNWGRTVATMMASTIGFGANSYPAAGSTVAAKQAMSMMGGGTDDRTPEEKAQSQKANQYEKLIRENFYTSESSLLDEVTAAVSSGQLNKKQADELMKTYSDDLGNFTKKYGTTLSSSQRQIIMENRQAMKILDYLYGADKRLDWKRINAALKFATAGENTLNDRAALAAAEAIVLEAVLRSKRLMNRMSTDEVVDLYQSRPTDQDRLRGVLIKKAQNAQKGGTLTTEERDKIRGVIPDIDARARRKPKP